MFRICGSLLGFLSSGLIIAVLKAEGTEPMESDPLIISRVGVKTGNSSLKRLDGIGFSMQVVGLEAVTRLVRASGESNSNCERVQFVWDTVSTMITVFTSCGPVILSLIKSILFVKNLRKSFAMHEVLLAG